MNFNNMNMSLYVTKASYIIYHRTKLFYYNLLRYLPIEKHLRIILSHQICKESIHQMERSHLSNIFVLTMLTALSVILCTMREQEELFREISGRV